MLHIHRAERTSALADALAELLRDPLDDPFATEVVAVPAKGVERWLTQRLSTVLGAVDGDGVCSGIAFPSPARLVEQVLQPAPHDPWKVPVWPLMAVVDESLGEPWCAILASHLGHGLDESDHRRGRRYATAAHLAELFSSYAAYRPAMLRDWAGGAPTGVPDDLRWQYELWRRLRARLGESPAERLERTCAAVRTGQVAVDLPPRLSVFGPTRLATDQLAVLEALAVQRDVHLWLPHPSPALWAQAPDRAVVLRRAARTRATHPLLRSFARDARELQLRLPADAVDTHHPSPEPASQAPARSLLGQLQRDLRDDVAPRPGPVDTSVQVHACHGPTRQVEVLREVLLHLFQDLPGLEPRDVVVMCPDVETFAPLVSAAFGLGPGLPHPGHALRVRLADRSLRQTNPLVATAARLLELAGSRVTASQVLDLASTPGVARMFGFDDDDLLRIRSWVAASGVRWGLDATTRVPFDLGGAGEANTWRAGLDRVLLGVTTSEDGLGLFGDTLPLDDVDSGDIALAGRFAELVDRLDVAVTSLSGRRSVSAWTTALGEALTSLASTSEADSWQLAQALRELGTVGAGVTTEVGIQDVRALLKDLFRGRPTRSNFRTGNLTVCTMVPMRSVPHRVVVLLGLDDGVYPRTGGVDGDDVLAREPRVGERDVRSEDRQLLLDAVVAAQERLVILCTGADPVSGAHRPPAVPVGELLDVLAVMAPDAQLVVDHTLQPYDAKGFEGPAPFSFDPVNLAGARRARLPRAQPAGRERLPARSGPVALADLVSFVEHPARGYVRQRLAITLPYEQDDLADSLDAELDDLQKWAVGDRLLTACLGGVGLRSAAEAELRRGTLPALDIGRRALSEVTAKVEPLLEASAQVRRGPPQVVDVALDLGGRLLTGSVAGVHDGAVVSVDYSSLGPKHELRAWVLGLALAAAKGGDRAVAVGRARGGAGRTDLRTDGDPLAVLTDLVALYDAGLREPLPMALKTSHAYAGVRLSNGNASDALTVAAGRWKDSSLKDGRVIPGEGADRYHAYVWGERPPFEVLTAAPARGDLAPGEPTRFGSLACRLWAPLRKAEQ